MLGGGDEWCTFGRYKNTNTMNIPVKDRKQEIEYLRSALNMVGLTFDYPTTDLLLRTQAVFKKKKGKFSISDGVDVLYAWKGEWDEYLSQSGQEQTNNQQDK